MGSVTPQASPWPGAAPGSYDLPDASSPHLILTRATPQERIRSWTGTFPLWGPALGSLETYLNRETYMTTVPLGKDGGITHWILTDSRLPPDQRPILSSCESLRKGAVAAYLSAAEDGKEEQVKMTTGPAHGIGSVFTEEQFRGRGYASRMMQEVGRRLKRWQVLGKEDVSEAESEEGPKSLCSILYSDIGKSFYAKMGWAAFPSTHVEFKPAPASGPRNERVRPIGYHELAELCSVDEQLVRAQLARRVRASKEKKKVVAVAVLPELDQLLWHMMREDYMTQHIFGRTPSVKGAVFGEKGNRMWAVWTRGYYGGLQKMEGNKMFILRFVIEDERLAEGRDLTREDEGYLAEGLRAIVQMAQAEAAEWRSQEVEMWNPTPVVKRLLLERGVVVEECECEFVEREKDSIPSLMWYGEGGCGTGDVEWVANEKYAWC